MDHEDLLEAWLREYPLASDAERLEARTAITVPGPTSAKAAITWAATAHRLAILRAVREEHARSGGARSTVCLAYQNRLDELDGIGS